MCHFQEYAFSYQEIALYILFISIFIFMTFYDIKNKERIYIKKIEKKGIRGSVSQRLPRNKGRLLPAFTCE